MLDSPEWKALQQHRDELAGLHLRAAFAADPQRFAKFHQRFDEAGVSLMLDYSRQRVDQSTLPLLLDLARARGVAQVIEQMFAGVPINYTERRAVLHVALRAESGDPFMVDGADVMPEVLAVRARMLACAEQVRSGHWRGATGLPMRDVVNIGIGGSDLGPQMMEQALRPYADGPRVHFVSNVDGAHLADTVEGLDPATTLFIVASKTFTTIETMTNAHSARRWLQAALGDSSQVVARHFVAVSTNRREVAAFGIDLANMFGFRDWVGGRYSVWSSIGLSVAMAIGATGFEAMLSGARAMDLHLRTAPLERNLPVLLALLGVWNINFQDIVDLAVAPYAQHLHRFAAHLQQLDMESNGKAVQADGSQVAWATGPLVFGEPGTNAQHAYFQWLHQGPRVVQADFLLAAQSETQLPEHHKILSANCFAQGQALMLGKTTEEACAEMLAAGMSDVEAQRLAPHRAFTGNRPSNTILVRRFDPATMGALLALYEHKVLVQGVIWGINSFDQWGVELGKQLATRLLPEMTQPSPSGTHDASTEGLIAAWHALRA